MSDSPASSPRSPRSPLSPLSLHSPLSPHSPPSPHSPLSPHTPTSESPQSPRSPVSEVDIPLRPHANASEESEEACETHKRFYFEDPMITLEVEHTAFKVHRYFLTRESKVLEAMFLLPAEGGKRNVVKLPDVTVAELEALLTFFYDGMHSLPQDWKFWSNLLSISTRFDFDKIRQQAIGKLSSSLTPIEKIYHGKKYDVSNWSREGYQNVCKRAQPLELSEAEKIGWEAAILLAKAREIYRSDIQSPFDAPPVGIFPTNDGGRTTFSGNMFQDDKSLEDEKAARAIDSVFGRAGGIGEPLAKQPVKQEAATVGVKKVKRLPKRR